MGMQDGREDELDGVPPAAVGWAHVIKVQLDMHSVVEATYLFLSWLQSRSAPTDSEMQTYQCLLTVPLRMLQDNAARGGSMSEPIFICKDRLWWGIETHELGAFATMLKNEQLAWEEEEGMALQQTRPSKK